MNKIFDWTYHPTSWELEYRFSKRVIAKKGNVSVEHLEKIISILEEYRILEKRR